MKASASPWPVGVGAVRQVDLRKSRDALSAICDMAWKGRGVRVYVSVAAGRAALVVPGGRSDELLSAACGPLLCGTYTIGTIERDVAADLAAMVRESPVPLPPNGAVVRGKPRLCAAWSEQEDAALRQHYPRGGSVAVQLHVDRSLASIRQRATALGVYIEGRGRAVRS